MLPPAYFKLVQNFPLTRIRDVAHLKDAQAVLDGLLQQDLDEGGQAYLDALTDLVENYEAGHVVFPDVPGRELLRFMMDQHGLSQNQLAKSVGISQSTISAILGGSRKMTADHMRRFGKQFNLPASAFLGE